MLETVTHKVTDVLHRLVLAVGHDYGCPYTKQACSCGKAEEIRLAHGEACSLLRAMGLLK